MLLTELHVKDATIIYQRFADIIGETHWKRHAAKLKQEIKGNQFLSDYIYTNNDIVLQLERLRELNAKYHAIPERVETIRNLYPALGFSAQILSIISTSEPKQAEQVRRRVHGAIKNPDDMRALRLELTTATHFIRRGHNVSWPEISGQGNFDLLIEDLGADGLEIECKAVSEDKGRKIHRRETLEFYSLLIPLIKPLLHSLRSGLAVSLTMPGRLPTQYKKRMSIAKNIAKQIINGKSTLLSDGVEIRITDFNPGDVGHEPSEMSHQKIRESIDQVTGTDNREAMIYVSSHGGIFALVLQSSTNDTLMKAVFDTLSRSSKRQLTGERSAIFVVAFDGISDNELLAIFNDDQNEEKSPSALQHAVSKFLSSSEREHVVGVSFFSQGNLSPHRHGAIDSTGSVYYFPKKETKYWDDVYSGIF